MMRLFHISDDATLTRFEPQSADTKIWPQLTRSYVWVVSDEMVHNYFFPRNCPRVCWMIGPDTTQEEKDRFRSVGDQRAIIAVEQGWKERIATCTLCQYEFSPRNFYPIDYCAGYYISEQTEIPVATKTLRKPLDLLAERGVRVEFHDDLESVRQMTANSNYRFSNIRMRFLQTMI